MTLVQVAKVVQLGKVLTVLGCLLWGNLISMLLLLLVQIKPQIISLEVVRVEVQCAAAPLLDIWRPRSATDSAPLRSQLGQLYS